MGRLIGIDLGTNNSCAVVLERGSPQVVPNREGARTTPSVVGFTRTGERLIGHAALRQAVINPRNTVFGVKRLIGRRYDSPECVTARRLAPYAIVAAPNGDAHVRIEDRTYSPAEIAAVLLAELKAAAEDHLGEPVEEAIITVPAYFNEAQRQATKDAGLIAGLKVNRLLNEATAAALAYGLKNAKGQFVAVYDLGGGTFDISILEVEDGLFQVKAIGGDTFLGGEDFDQRVIDWLVTEFLRETGIDLGPDPSSLMRLKEAAEKAKCELSVVRETEIVLPFISGDAADPVHLKSVLSRQKYESLTEDLLEQTVAPCWRCLDDARLRADQIGTVLLVGGQSRGLAVAEVIRRVFGREPSRAGNPDESVATGAAIQTGITLGEVRDLVLLDVTPHSLGIETRDGTFTPLIERNSTIPTRKARVFTTKADNQTRLEVHVLQGESDMAAYNKSLAKFALNDIRPAAKGVPQIEVSFEIDVNGITSVGALDLATGSRQSLTIHPSSGLSRSEVLSLADEARQREAAERNDATKNDLLRQLGSLITYALHWVQVIDGHISPEDRDVILEALAEAKQARRRDGIEALKASLGRMERAASLIAVAVLGRDRPLEGA